MIFVWFVLTDSMRADNIASTLTKFSKFNSIFLSLSILELLFTSDVLCYNSFY